MMIFYFGLTIFITMIIVVKTPTYLKTCIILTMPFGFPGDFTFKANGYLPVHKLILYMTSKLTTME